jgi:hypothetical protein
VWLIYMNLEHISHYLSTTPDMDITIPPPPPPQITRGANGSSAMTRRAPSSRSRLMVILMQYDLAHGLPLPLPLH